MRVEWCKARARANRWAEEVELLQEEMRRVAAFFEWHAAWWDERAAVGVGFGEIESEALIAYASRQVAIRKSMRKRCLVLWSVVPDLLSQLRGQGGTTASAT
jgi:hypothetical protein